MRGAGEIRHLLVRLPNWLGDTVMALAALRALRAGLPAPRITLVGPWAPLLAEQGVGDAWLRYPRGWGQRLCAIPGLRRLGADTALLLPNSLESALAARLWGVRRVIGYATDGRARLLSDPLPPPSPRRHQVDEYVGLLGPFGIDRAEASPRWVAVGGGREERAEALLAARGGAGGARIGIHLGAAFGPSKLWPDERLAELCRRLRRLGRTPILLGAPADRARADAVITGAGGGVVSLVGEDAPEMLPALLARLEALVSMDTGVAHLAAAVGIPVVTLFGPTDPALTAPRGARASAIWKPPRCAPCFLAACPIDHPCMRSIEVDEVLEHLAASSRRP